jgi:hypothetical protein
MASHPRGLKSTLALLWQHQMLGKLQGLQGDSYVDHLLCRKWSPRKAEPDIDVWHTLIWTSRASLRHVCALCRLIFWCHSKLIFLKLFDLGQDWRTFLRMCAQIVDNCAIIFFHLWKHKFTGTIFPFIPVTS